MRIVDASDSSLLVIFGDSISPELNREVVALFHSLRAAALPAVRDLHPAYASLLIDFDPLQMTHAELRSVVEGLYKDATEHPAKSNAVVEIPVCYGGEFGPDLTDVACHCGKNAEEVVRIHTSGECVVYFLGFAPGFAYLGGMSPEIAAPRLGTPRKLVPAGSVGIAGNQTGIYAIDSPGGWRLIGRTPLTLFDPGSPQPARLQPGDRVRFVAISRDEFERHDFNTHDFNTKVRR
jgi:inhibitor of KinA